MGKEYSDDLSPEVIHSLIDEIEEEIEEWEDMEDDKKELVVDYFFDHYFQDYYAEFSNNQISELLIERSRLFEILANKNNKNTFSSIRTAIQNNDS